ncbi:MAG: PQQ-binding-like beta-propeller repeat protein [Caldisericia bacterium]|nr:PQQ-binding-like beta-propeller repeat protein [Caldisericia bacterium]
MKRIISILISFCLVFGVFIGENAFGENGAKKVDSLGNNPWVTIAHDSMMSGMSLSELGEDFEEAEDWPFDSDAGSGAMLGRGSIIYDGILFVQLNSDLRGSSSEVIAVEVDSGEEIWRTEIDGRLAFTAPVIDEELGLIIAAATNGYAEKGSGETLISALTLEDGEVEWTSTSTGAISCPLTISDGAVYFKAIFGKPIEDNEDYDSTGDDSIVVKIDAESGDVEWEADIEGAWYLEWDAPCAVVGDYVYAATCNYGMNSKTGSIRFLGPARLYCLDTESGDIEWDMVDTLGLAGSGICADDEFVYFARSRIDMDSNQAEMVVSAHELESGSEEWEFSANGVMTWWCSPVCNDDSVFVQERGGKVWAISKDDGDKEWSKGVGDMIYNTAIALAGDYVIAAGWETSGTKRTGSEMMILDASRRGKKVWTEKCDEEINHVAVYGNRIFFTGKVEIYCYEAMVPKLVVDPEKIELEEVERNTKTEINLSLENKGVEGLEGTVEVDQDWLTIDIEKVDDETTEATVTINTWDLDPDDYSGRIVFDTNGGKVIVPVLITVVDEEPPVIEWDFEDFKLIDEKLYTNQKEAVLKGKTEPTAYIIINGEDAEVDSDGLFELEIELKEGKNEIEVKTEDDLGNKGEEALELYLDTKPPELTVSTKDYTLSTEENFYIIGQCKEDNVIVTIDEEEIELGKAGKFAVEVTLEKGENVFVLKATDQFGNETVIDLHIVYPKKKIVILQIGNKEAEVNGQITILEAPPTIINGRTMVPLRFIAETFGAELGWDGKDQKITLNYYGQVIELWIGRKTAMVDDDPMILEAPPTIINGRTMVPLRFIAETFGAELGWDGDTQTITLIYPKTS